MGITDDKWAKIQLEVLHQVRGLVWGMKSSEDIAQVVTAVQEGLRRLGIPFTRFGVNVVEENVDALTVHFYTIPPGEKVKVETESIDETSKAMLIVDWWRGGEVVYRKDLSCEDPHGEYIWCSAWDILCVLDVPFSHGTLAVSSDQPDAFSTEDIQTLEEMTRVLSEGFQRQEDLLNLERRNRQLETEIKERRRAEEITEVSLALQRVRNEILLMEEEDDWGKVVQRLELDEVEDVVARAVELHDERVRGNG